MNIDWFLFILTAFFLSVHLILNGIRGRKSNSVNEDLPTADYFIKIKEQYPEAAEQWQAVNDAQY